MKRYHISVSPGADFTRTRHYKIVSETLSEAISEARNKFWEEDDRAPGTTPCSFELHKIEEV